MIVIYYGNCLIESGHEILEFDIPFQIGNTKLDIPYDGYCDKYFKQLIDAIRVYRPTEIDLSFLCLLTKEQRTELAEVLGNDVFVMSMAFTSDKLIREGETYSNTKKYLYSRHLNELFEKVIRVYNKQMTELGNDDTLLDFEEIKGYRESYISTLDKTKEVCKARNIDYLSISYDRIKFYSYE